MAARPLRRAGLLAALALAVTTLPVTSAAAPAAPSAVVVAARWTPVPSYRIAATDEPVTYRNGCHAWRPVTRPQACTIVNRSADRTVLLFGDSHAAHWYAAVRKAAVAHDWRMLYLTKSSCPAADVAVRGYQLTIDYPQCSTWRRRALPALAESRWGTVDVAVVSDWDFHTVLSSPRGRRLTPAQKVTAWESGTRRTLRAILRGVPHVVLLRDSPDLPGSASTARACYRQNGLAAQRKCGAPVGRALKGSIWRAEQRAAASFPGRVTVVDLTTPTCRDGWCGPIDKPYLAFKDDNHWTQTYVRAHFRAPVDALLTTAMERVHPTA
jgi:hypothetical protein